MDSAAQGSGPKRRKCGGSKVKGGCQTCKLRHIKCDQGKPICGRCFSTTKKCIYPDPFRLITSNEQHLESERKLSSTIPRSSSTETTLYPSLDSAAILPLDSRGRLDFYYFRQKACAELSSLLPAEFWVNYVLPMSASTGPVQYAIVALASQHRSYLEGRSGESDVLDQSKSRSIYSLRLYAEAVKSLNLRLQEKSTRNDILQETLVTCLVFICFDVLRGNDVGALTHLDAGLRIYKQYSKALRETVNEMQRVDGPITQLIGSLTRLDLQAALYLGSHQVKSSDDLEELDCCPEPPFELRMISHCEFKTIQEARRSLEKLMTSTFYFMRSTTETLKYTSDDGRTSLEYKQAEHHRYTHIRKLQHWHDSFQYFLSIRSSLDDDTDQVQIHECLVSYATTVISLSVCLSPYELAYNEHLPLFLEIISSAATILRPSSQLSSSQPRSRPIFDLEMSLIQPLYFTALKCRDLVVRYRAIDLLQECGKEGVWDGEIMTCIARHVVSLEECERVMDISTGKMEISEESMVCGTSIHLMREERKVWVQCSTRKQIPISDDSWNACFDGFEGGNAVQESGVSSNHRWEFSETWLYW